MWLSYIPRQPGYSILYRSTREYFYQPNAVQGGHFPPLSQIQYITILRIFKFRVSTVLPVALPYYHTTIPYNLYLWTSNIDSVRESRTECAMIWSPYCRLCGESQWVSPIDFGFLYMGEKEVPTQNIWGTMAHRVRDLGHSRCLFCYC